MNQLPFAEEDFAEDYFFDTENDKRKHKVYALVIYDIIDNKQRTRFAKFMNGFGTRVQKSCFETMVPMSSFRKMLRGIEKFCGDEDSIRVYRLTGIDQVYQWGRKGPPEEDDVIIL